MYACFIINIFLMDSIFGFNQFIVCEKSNLIKTKINNDSAVFDSRIIEFSCLSDKRSESIEEMMPKLYMTEVSPAVRAVLMTAKILKITLDLKEVKLQDKEQLSPKFLKLNPQHTVPTLEDNGLIIWDSHAIIAYLVGKYGAYDSLYPKDIQKRAIIDQRLHFDSGVVSHVLKTVMNPIIYGDCVEIPQDFNDKIVNIYDLVEAFLEEDWIAGTSLSIADFSLIASMTTLNVIWPIDYSKYPRMARWIKKSEKEPFYDGNKGGLDKFECFIRCRECLEQ